MGKMISFIVATMTRATMLLAMIVAGIAPVLSQATPETESGWSHEPFEAHPDAIFEAFSQHDPPEDADIAYLTRHGDYHFDDHGRVTYTQYVLFQVLSQEGVDAYATVSRQYAPWHQSRPEFRYRVITPEREIFELDPTTLVERPIESGSDEVFEDRLSVEAPLPALEVGAVVEGTRVRRDTEVFFGGGSVVRHYLQSARGPIWHDRVTLRAPQELLLHYVVRKMDGLEPVIETANGQTTYSFETHGVSADKDIEVGMPSEMPRWSYLGVATGKDWASVANAYSALVDARLDGTALPALELEGAGASRRQIVDATLAWVHGHVRYTGLELGAAAIVPVAPQTVLERRYGDCKDKSTLLVSLLREQGIAANVALLRAGSGEDLDPELPGLGQMNHAIVYLEQDDLWIDPTDPQSRAGELPLADQGRWALVAASETEVLRKTPASESGDNRMAIETRVDLAAYGQAALHETIVLSGSLENAMRTAIEAVGEEELREAIETGLEARYLSANLVDLKHGDAVDLSTPLSLEYTVSEVSRGVSDLDNAVYAIRLDELLEELPAAFLTEPAEDEEAREHDYVFYQPHSIIWRFDIRAPAGMSLRSVPDAEEITWPGGGFSKHFQETESGAEAVYQVSSGDRRLTPEGFVAARHAISELATRGADLLWFDHTAQADLAAGRTLEAVAGFRRLIAANPRDALNRSRFARVLVSLGLGREARRLAHEAVALAPDSAVAAWVEATVLQYDEIGRPQTAGAEMAAARALLEHAVSLDAEDQDIRLAHAVIADYNDEAVRYGLGATLDQAVDAYRAYREDFEDNGLDINLQLSLLHAGRFAELVEESEALPAEATRNIMLVTGLAVESGVDAAIERAEILTQDQATFFQLMTEVANQLVGARRYAEAARFLSRAATGSDDPSAVMNQARALRNIKPYSLREQPDSAESLMQRFIAALFRPQIDAEVFKSLLHPELYQRLATSEAGLVERFEALRGTTPRTLGSFTLDVTLDLLFGTWKIDLDGTVEEGALVTASSQKFGLGTAFSVFVVSGAAGPVIVGFEGALGEIGHQMVEHVDAGATDRAAHWLKLIRGAFIGTQDDDDPLGAVAQFRRLLRTPEVSPEFLRRVGGVLMGSDAAYSDIAIGVLEDGLQGEMSVLERDTVEHALAGVLADTGREGEALALMESLRERYPDSRSGFSSIGAILLLMKDWERFDALVRSRLEDPEMADLAWRLAGTARMREGDRGQAMAAYREIEKLGKAEAVDFNNLAWLGLFADEVSEEALDHALQASELAGESNYSTLHTIASVFASLGRPQEAYKIILQAIASKTHPEPGTVDWYCFGRIAEAYGLADAAVAFYELIEPEDEESPFSTFALASNRLAGLERADAMGDREGTP